MLFYMRYMDKAMLYLKGASFNDKLLKFLYILSSYKLS